MNNKERDVAYCGVNKEKILTAKPTVDLDSIYHFRTFVIDRYELHKRKDVYRIPAPWTNNPILSTYRFTNIRREHDRQTRYLIKNVSTNPNLTLEDKIVNSFLFRSWNNWATLKDFGFPYKAEQLYNPDLKEKIRPLYKKLKEENPNRSWYSNAYNQGGTKCAWKFAKANHEQRPYKFGNERLMNDQRFSDYEQDIPLRPFHVGVWLGEDDIAKRLLKAEDQLEAFNIIKSIRGFANFLAYQVFVDLTYIEDFPFSENEFTVAGPGCKRGLDYIFRYRDGMTYEECLFWLRNSINSQSLPLYKMNDKLTQWENKKGYPHRVYDPEKLFDDLPEEDRCMNVMSLENCMCEFSKYIKAVYGTGRPKNRYVYK